jgi:hypothetical protein
MKKRRAWNKGMSRIKTARGKYDYYKGSRWSPVAGLLGSMVLCLWLQFFGQSYNLSKMGIEAQEYKSPVVVVEERDEKELSQEQKIIMYIVEVFGEDSVQAIKIAECESRFNPHTIGDTHLMSNNAQTGEWIGDSIGIFQVRTGGSDWNRANANGLSVEEFRARLHDYKYNIDYAKTIFDRNGWEAWHNCAVKTNAY